MVAYQAPLFSMVPMLRAAEERSLSGAPCAIGAYNVNFYAQALGILRGLMEAEAPGVIQASAGACSFTGGPAVVREILLRACKDAQYQGMFALHLDHGNEETARQCIDARFSSVMIDASGKKHNYKDLPEGKQEYTVIENFAATEAVTSMAHALGISTEGELGQLAGVEGWVEHKESKYTDPVIVPAFFRLTGADACAISYGTSHGAFKGETDKVKTAILSQVYQMLYAYRMNLNHFLVSHGSSTVPPEAIARIEQHGGDFGDKKPQGMHEGVLRQAVAAGARKVNIDTDLRLWMTAYARQQIFTDNPGWADASERIGLMKRIFTGEIEARSKGKVVPQGEITDPRSWLQPLIDQDAASLTEDYHNTGDEPFIALMDGIVDIVSAHVARLSADVFGGQGLVNHVDRTLTLEQMAKAYRS